MQQNLISLGVLIVFFGIILIFIGALSGAKSGETKVAFVGLIGPIPFGFGNDKRLVFIGLGITVALALFWLWTVSR